MTRSQGHVTSWHFRISTVNMEKQYRVGVLSRLKVVEAEPKLTQHRVAWILPSQRAYFSVAGRARDAYCVRPGGGGPVIPRDMKDLKFKSMT